MGKDRFKIRDLSADERCSHATTDVGRLAPTPAEKGIQSEVSEQETWEREERAEGH